MVKSLKPIDRQLLLVTIYLEIAFCGEFKNEEVRRAVILFEKIASTGR